MILLNDYLKSRFGCKVYKLALDGGFTCPNRDGTLGTRGCIFCLEGSGGFAEPSSDDIREQIEKAKKRVEGKIKDGKYIAYFQSYTNTYAPVSKLRELFTAAITHPDIVALSVATRPDCLPEETIALLSELNKIKPVWVELGLQTIHEKTAEYIRRGYPLSVYDEAVSKLRAAGIETIVHMIVGLPGETTEQIVETARYIGESGVQGIKIQLLHVLEGTDLAEDYKKGLVPLPSMEEYIEIVKECIAVLPENIIIHRITGDGPKRSLIAPQWSGDKKKVLNALSKALCLIVAFLLLFLAGCTGPSHEESCESPSHEVSSAEPLPTESVKPTAQIQITELLTNNTLGIKDENGMRWGWVEVYNYSSSDADLGDYYLSDGKEIWNFPSIILHANEYTYFFANCSGSGISFYLPNHGPLKLLLGDTVIQEVQYKKLEENYSYLVSSGETTLQVTPGYDVPKEADQLYISELMPANRTYPINGTLCDWIELYNAGEETLDLSNYALSDNETSLYKSPLPVSKICPGEYLIICCEIDTNFSLADDGTEKVVLTRLDGVICDSVDIPACESDNSVLHDMTICTSPTPGYSNENQSVTLLYQAYSKDKLRINEVISSNTTAYKAPDKNYYDTIELYNASEDTIVLSNYYLSDKKSNLQQWKLPDVTLEPGQYYVVFATGEENSEEIYAPFSIDYSGDKLYLSENGNIVDCVLLPEIPSNCSYGRSEDSWVYYSSVSFGKKNKGGYPRISSTVTADIAPGIYNSALSVTLSADDGGTIYYTTDGSKPTKSSKKYQGETIEITKTTAIRAVNFCGEQIASKIAAFNYLIDIPEFTLDILKVSINPSDFDWMYENYYTTKEFEANVSYFKEGIQQFSVNCGFKMQGKSSRALEKKSFQLKFRAIYGTSELNYKLFDNLDIDSFESIVIRSGSAGAASFRYFINDEFATSVAGESDYSDLLVQGYKPVNLYINDTYYGIYFLREKIDDNFVASHKNVDPDSVTIIHSMSKMDCGSEEALNEWKDLWNYILNHDIDTEEEFDYLYERIDMESVCDYYLMQSWSGNTDAANVRVYKTTEGDGKWHMLLFDLDQAFCAYKSKYGLGTVNAQIGTYTPGYSGAGAYNALFYKMIHNCEKFQQLFFTILAHWAQNEFQASYLLEHCDEIYNLIHNDMQYSIPVWADRENDICRYYRNMAEWEKVMKELRTCWLVEKRTENLVKEYIQVVGLTEDQVLSWMGEA